MTPALLLSNDGQGKHYPFTFVFSLNTFGTHSTNRSERSEEGIPQDDRPGVDTWT